MIDFVVFKILCECAYPHYLIAANNIRPIANRIIASLGNKERQQGSGDNLVKLETKDSSDFDSLDDILINFHL